MKPYAIVFITCLLLFCFSVYGQNTLSIVDEYSTLFDIIDGKVKVGAEGVYNN